LLKETINGHKVERERSYICYYDRILGRGSKRSYLYTTKVSVKHFMENFGICFDFECLEIIISILFCATLKCDFDV